MMGELETDIEYALHLAHKEIANSNEFFKYSGCFLFGTESQSGINSIIDYKGKDVLTPASSGDQYLGAVYYDAKKVDLFDINRMTYFITCLKIAAVCVLDYQEFVAFFMPLDQNGQIKKSFWSLSTLKRLLKVMPSNVAYFWDKVMYETRRCGFEDLIIPCDRKNEFSNLSSGMPFYAGEKEYYELQAKLRMRNYPEFIESAIVLLKDKLTTSYDILYLSNIVECMVYERLRYVMFSYQGMENDAEEIVLKEVLESVMPYLRKDGMIMLSYRPNNRSEYCYDVLYNNSFFDVTEISSKYPPSDQYRRTEDTDLVLTYKPSRTGNILPYLR